MTAELDHVEDDGEALSFAVGCLGTSLRANVEAAPPGVRLARMAIAAVTVAYALFHLGAALNGLERLAGTADPHYALLLRRNAAGAEAYLALRPFTVLLMAGVGVSHLIAAVFLVAWRPRLFTGALVVGGAAIAAHTLASAVILGSRLWPAQTLPLLLLAAAGAALALAAKPGRARP